MKSRERNVQLAERRSGMYDLIKNMFTVIALTFSPLLYILHVYFIIYFIFTHFILYFIFQKRIQRRKIEDPSNANNAEKSFAESITWRSIRKLSILVRFVIKFLKLNENSQLTMWRNDSLVTIVVSYSRVNVCSSVIETIIWVTLWCIYYIYITIFLWFILLF